MSSLVACEMSDRFAAVAPVAGLQFPDGCDPGRPVPVLVVPRHGRSDPAVQRRREHRRAAAGARRRDGPTTTSTSVPTDLDGEGYPAAARDWAEHNGCEDSTDEDVSEEVILRTFDCPDGADVEFYIVEGGGHSWPGSEFSKSIESIVGPTTFDIDATDLIWTSSNGSACRRERGGGAAGSASAGFWLRRAAVVLVVVALVGAGRRGASRPRCARRTRPPPRSAAATPRDRGSSGSGSATVIDDHPGASSTATWDERTVRRAQRVDPRRAARGALRAACSASTTSWPSSSTSSQLHVLEPRRPPSSA